MADSASYVGSTPVNNPLLSGAGNSFPFENFTSTAQLVPISQRVSSISLSEDVGEADSFLGQDALPSLPLPGVQPSALKTPSPEQLQPITFFNALGQPTGGGGLDFLAPAGANSKSIDSSNQPRYKHLVNKRRPLSATLGLSPAKSLNIPPASRSCDLLPPAPVASSSTIKSPLLQQPSITTQLSLLTTKSSSTPNSPKTQIINTSSSGDHVSRSQPSTLKPSPVHVQSTLHVNPFPLKPEDPSPKVQPLIPPDGQTSAPYGNTLGQSLVQKLLNLTSETLSPSPQKQVSLSEPEVTETKSAGELSAPFEPEVPETKLAGELLAPSDPELCKAKLAAELSASSKPKVAETKLGGELAAEETSSLTPTVEVSDVAKIKSATSEGGSLKPAVTATYPSDVTDSVSNAASHSSLEGTNNQILLHQSPNISDEKIASSVEENASLSSSKQPETLPSGDLIGFSTEPLPLPTTEKSSLHTDTDILTSEDYTYQSTNQSQGPYPTEAEVSTSSNQISGSVLNTEAESQFSTNQTPLASQSDTDSLQYPAKSASASSQPSSTEAPPLQPHTTPNLIQNTNSAVTHQHSNHIVKSPQTNYQSTENPYSYQNQTLPTLSTTHIPSSHYSSDIQTVTAWSNAQSPNNQYFPPGTQPSQTHVLNPPFQSSTARTHSSPNPYRVKSGLPSVTPPLQYSNSLAYYPQQFLIPVAQNTTGNAYSQPPSGESEVINSSQFPVNRSQSPSIFSPISQQSSLPVYPSSTPPTIPVPTPPPPAQQTGILQPSSNRYSIHAKPPSAFGVNFSHLPVNKSQSQSILSPISQQSSLPVYPSSTPRSIPVPTPPPAVQQTGSSQTSSNRYSIHAQPSPNDIAVSAQLPVNKSQPPSIFSPISQQSSLPVYPSSTPPPAVQQTGSSQTSSNRYSIHAQPSPNEVAVSAQLPVNKSQPPSIFSPISQQSSLPVYPSSTPPSIQVPAPPSIPVPAPPSISVPTLPPAAQQTGISQTSSNRYSIHARPAHLRNPYRVYSPTATQSSPVVGHSQPPHTKTLSPYLAPSESESLSSVPLTSDASFGSSKDLSAGQSGPPLPPLPSSSPVVPTSSATQLVENYPNLFLAQGAVTPPNYPLQHFNNISAEHTPDERSASFTIEDPNHPDQIPSSVDKPLANTTPATGTLLLPQPSQECSSDSLNAATPPNTVPTISSSIQPPSGIPLGATKSYRLGKQRPKYAQVPDLAVSSSSPLFSPLGLSRDLPVDSSPEVSAYQTQECFVPSEDFASPYSEFSSPLYSNLATQQGSNVASAYQPVYCHWFFKKEVESKVIWKPFSVIDSVALENAFNSSETTADTIVPTDGGRYDVRILQRERVALYWEEKKPTEVRRCSWFYKGPLDSRYTPYEEIFASQLEEEYKDAVKANKWNRKVEYNGETVVMHGPVVMVHYSPATPTDQIGVPADTSPVKPRVVKRGVEEFEFEEGESSKVDHLLFLVHGIGSVCDLKFRDVVETVDDFRSLALQLTRSHFSAFVESGQASRVEVLPVSWHGKLHGEDTGIDKKLQSITLRSIPRLRHFTNDTLLDILFYTSPVYCQTIMDTVGNEMNRMYDMFLKRNPDFSGTVCLGGHSLGSLILFDLLYHQKAPKHLPSSPAIVMTVPGARPPIIESKPQKKEEDGEEEDDILDDEAMAMRFARTSGHNRRASRINYMMGPAGTGQPYISYPQLKFKPESFFALGSPIGMFVTVRGIETLGNSFRLPTCPGFFNIFHPFDPVAYRIESLIDPELAPTLRPVLIPHHKGRKRMHLELKETMQRVGSDLKNKLVDSVKNTWNTMTHYTMFSRPEPPPPPTLEQEVTKALEAHLGPAQLDSSADTESESGDQPTDVTLGCLNGGRRVDYVLQEAPLESFNEYLFALQSHVCYWESEDTMLMILTEVYRSSGVSPDSAITGTEMTRERSPIQLLSEQFLPSASPPKPQLFSSLRFPSSSSLSSDGNGESVTRTQSIPKLNREASPGLLSTSSPANLQLQGGLPQMGMDPTAPMTDTRNLAPPPTAGFVKQALQRK